MLGRVHFHGREGSWPTIYYLNNNGRRSKAASAHSHWGRVGPTNGMCVTSVGDNSVFIELLSVCLTNHSL